MEKLKIRVPRKKLAEFCRRNHIRKLAFFGSVLRDDFGPESDVDVLVEFEPGKTPGFAFFGLQEELSALLGHMLDNNIRFNDNINNPPVVVSTNPVRSCLRRLLCLMCILAGLTALLPNGLRRTEVLPQFVKVH